MDGGRAGQLIGGRYRLVSALGQGGMGRVWRARDEVLDCEVAVKELVLPAGLPAAERTERVLRARREARNAARLREHPNIITIHDIVTDGDAPWIVMELLEVRDLAQLIAEQGPLPVPRVAEIAAALLDALSAAHAAGITHRDVKPANVLITGSGRVVLTDFGIAVQAADTALTATGEFIGSVEYIAPERARGAGTGPAADLFSLGATLYCALEGRPPFGRGNPAEVLTAVLFNEPVPPVRSGPLGPLVLGLLAKDPARRLTAEQAAARLAGGAAAVPAAGARARQPEPTAPRTARATRRAPAAPAPGAPAPEAPVAAAPAAAASAPGSAAPVAAAVPVARRDAAARAAARPAPGSWTRPPAEKLLKDLAWGAVVGVLFGIVFGANHLWYVLLAFAAFTGMVGMRATARIRDGEGRAGGLHPMVVTVWGAVALGAAWVVDTKFLLYLPLAVAEVLLGLFVAALANPPRPDAGTGRPAVSGPGRHR